MTLPVKGDSALIDSIGSRLALCSFLSQITDQKWCCEQIDRGFSREECQWCRQTTTFVGSKWTCVLQRNRLTCNPGSAQSSCSFGLLITWFLTIQHCDEKLASHNNEEILCQCCKTRQFPQDTVNAKHFLDPEQRVSSFFSLVPAPSLW